MEQWVTIYTFNYPHEAYVIKGKLESEGIIVFLKDENTVQTYNFLSNALGGVKLQVREGDVEDAMEIMSELDLQSNLEVETESNEEDEPVSMQKKIVQCPNCNSNNTSETARPDWIFALSVIMLGFPLIFLKRRFHCFECGENFKKVKNKSSA